MRRWALVPIDDKRVESLTIVQNYPEGVRGFRRDVVPVPSDDQLTRDLDTYTRVADWNYDPGTPEYEAAMRLRAAFDLDQEDG